MIDHVAQQEKENSGKYQDIQEDCTMSWLPMNPVSGLLEHAEFLASSNKIYGRNFDFGRAPNKIFSSQASLVKLVRKTR